LLSIAPLLVQTNKQSRLEIRAKLISTALLGKQTPVYLLSSPAKTQEHVEDLHVPYEQAWYSRRGTSLGLISRTVKLLKTPQTLQMLARKSNNTEGIERCLS
jgi:hypothetical protein